MQSQVFFYAIFDKRMGKKIVADCKVISKEREDMLTGKVFILMKIMRRYKKRNSCQS